MTTPSAAPRPTSQALAVCYAQDPRLQEAANAQGCNCWYTYVAEVLSRMGADAQPLPLSACGSAGALARAGVLVLGNFAAPDLPEGAGRALGEWVAGGGVLIGLATEGLDDLFGVTGLGGLPQVPDPFSISAYWDLLPSPVTAGCRAAVDPDQPLIVLAPARRLRCTHAAPLARLLLPDPQAPGDGRRARDSGLPAVTGRRMGAGHAFYFAFDAAQTLWVLQQGRPVDRDWDGDGYLRRTDASVVADNSRGVPYADAVHFLLENMVGRLPVPLVDPIPPRQGRPAPALLYFGGDDECTPGIQVPASDFMAARGLPYHLNLMPGEGRFALSPQEQAQVEANGHELALHYDFTTGYQHPCGFARQDVLAQARLFRARFGRDCVCSVNHAVRWVGWAEPGRWMREAGGRADNSFFGWTSPPTNPVNTLGFVHGSAFPRRLWDDAEHGNAPLDFLEIPITGYELGYEGESFLPERVSQALDLALAHHLTLEFFYHPVYIARYPACRRAIDELVRLLGLLETPPVLMGPDQVCRWWEARSRARLTGALRRGQEVRFAAACDWPEGFVVRVPVGQELPAEVRVDGRPQPTEWRTERGQHWLCVPLGAGRHEVEVRLGGG
ncbi:MAG: hypothetical protein AB1505_23580 [Candidatus Latescibacterota bacterium]